MSFAATAAGLYAAGQVTPDVIRIAAARFPEPLAGEFQVMIGKRNTDKKASFPAMFESLAVRYGLPEFNAIALIVAASERAGGPHAASEGLKHLAAAMRARDRRLGERRKETLQPLIAAGMVMIIIALGFLLDVTMLSSLYFSTPSGKFMLTITSLLILIMLLMVMKALDPKDLLGGV
jgi:Flp pilus assembly protein TadB